MHFSKKTIEKWYYTALAASVVGFLLLPDPGTGPVEQPTGPAVAMRTVYRGTGTLRSRGRANTSPPEFMNHGCRLNSQVEASRCMGLDGSMMSSKAPVVSST